MDPNSIQNPPPSNKQREDDLLVDILKRIDHYNANMQRLQKSNLGLQYKKMKLNFEEEKVTKEPPVKCAFEEIKKGSQDLS